MTESNSFVCWTVFNQEHGWTHLSGPCAVQSKSYFTHALLFFTEQLLFAECLWISIEKLALQKISFQSPFHFVYEFRLSYSARAKMIPKPPGQGGVCHRSTTRPAVESSRILSRNFSARDFKCLAYQAKKADVQRVAQAGHVFSHEKLLMWS